MESDGDQGSVKDLSPAIFFKNTYENYVHRPYLRNQWNFHFKSPFGWLFCSSLCKREELHDQHCNHAANNYLRKPDARIRQRRQIRVNL